MLNNGVRDDDIQIHPTKIITANLWQISLVNVTVLGAWWENR